MMQELRDYLKRQQDLEREERVAQREYEREKREAYQKEKDKEQNEKESELEKMKIEAVRKNKEMVMEKFKIEAEVELKKNQGRDHFTSLGAKREKSNPRSTKLPYFDEHTDKMDGYLTRFKSYAISNKWDPSMWASYLSALLK